MKNKRFCGSILLTLTALIWGTSFVAQSVSNNYIGSFTFNAIRFLIGGIVLIPIIFTVNKFNKKDDKIDKTEALNYFKETDETYLALEAYSTALETRNASIDSEMKFLNEAIDAFQKEHENGIKDDTNFWCFGGG